ncbi:MAG: hypothetical protein IT254_06000 [Chitinophagaceae bacterium]|nr:hypothetical protein [Bacteroidota bacterium]MCC6257853.1 hypothetical protein [Chitinophagaceae bacterium]MCW5916169.1 hypothetical protein [Ferruginibacter sp.]
MNNSNRDLLVLFKQDLMSPQAIEMEVTWLHELLYNVERLDNFVLAHEVIDLVRYKVTNNPVEIKKMVRNKKEQAFIFLNNKN